MADGIIAGVFTLAGVVIGVLLEPVKAAFATRARTRQERAERCAQLLEAVSRSGTWLISLNRQFRDQIAGRTPTLDSQAYERVVTEFVSARQDMRRLVWLLRLSGPDELAIAAQRLREAERKLRDRRDEPDDDQSDGRDAMPRAVRRAREELDAELGRFADTARRAIG
jgi:hypothetical protein